MSPVGLQERQVGGEVNIGVIHNRGCLLMDLGPSFTTEVSYLTWTCRWQQITLLPMSTKGSSSPSVLLCTKDKKQG